MLDIVFRNRLAGPGAGTSRRDFLRRGGLGSLGLASLFRSPAARGAGASGSTSRARSVILVFLGGGLSQLDSFDPKPDAPSEIRGPYQTIPTTVPGLRVTEKLPLLASAMHKVALVRSGSHDSDHHETASNWVLSGRLGSAFGDFPAMGAVVAHETGPIGAISPHVAVPRNPSFTWELGKSAYLGARCESFKSGDPSGLDSRARSRAFAIEKEPEKLRDRYGRTTAGQSMLLARRLVESGTRFVTVNYGGWDHHNGIFGNLDRKLPEFDHGFSALIEDLEGRGLLKETLVVAMGEFGRAPRLNSNAGRDHWPAAASMLFAGAGIKPGFVLGRTDRHGAYVEERPVAPAEVASTIFDSLGIDARKRLLAADGRPIPILDQGQPIRELLLW